MTIFEALAVGGDLSTYSDRKHVKVLRQMPSGETEIKEFDIRSQDILGSEYYFIQPNDIIYVKAFKGQFFRVNSFLTAIGITSTTISFGVLIWSIVNLCKGLAGGNAQ
jgi:polysaccharide export outer membrane protein